MNRPGRLVKGKIPPHTECPYKNKCINIDSCNHKSITHKVEFSCGMARLYDTTRGKYNA